MRISRMICVNAAALSAAVASVSYAQVPVERNDVIYGRNRSVATDSLNLIRGFPTGMLQSSQWSAPFIQSVQFDNLDGFQHAHFGNLLGVNFGVAATGGIIHNFETRFTGGTNPGASEQIFDFPTYNTNNPAMPLTISRLGGMSVSPFNNRVAVSGFDSGNVYVLDYSASNGTGTGAMLSNGRELNVFTPSGATGTPGTTWLDNDTVLTINAAGSVDRVTVAGPILTSTNVANLPVAPGTSNFSALHYDPVLSPFVFAATGIFDGVNSFNTVWVMDPNNSFALVKQVDYSTSINAKTIREIGLNSEGHMLIGHFVNTTSLPAWESIALVQNAVDVPGLMDNNSTNYYTQDPASQLSAQFSGLDVASTSLDYKTPGQTVNLRTRSHVQRFFGASPLSEIRARIQSGYAGGAWTGTGITSTDAAANPGYAVGYGDAGALGLIGGMFGGEPVMGPAVVFRYTRFGDANLDGIVNLSDFNALAANFGAMNAFWHMGDFNYDGQVNLSDFNALAAQFGMSAGPDGPTPEDWAALAGAIPEPASLTLLGVAALTLVRRRR